MLCEIHERVAILKISRASNTRSQSKVNHIANFFEWYETVFLRLVTILPLLLQDEIEAGIDARGKRFRPQDDHGLQEASPVENALLSLVTIAEELLK